ncbi:type II secretion system protein I (GspI) [Pseudomonas sp. SLBN-26]|uniref:type II secretion system minor pseudopilin GspI n=1 Tax=Pseudomonadaceae TaxID=135621 RepID=UPI00114E2B2A|nr:MULTISPECIES: type II secretion system minor pseudopilin GspI [Pseudomonas]MCP1616498.1 general secretion pathway protein I [Pseudomonas otitidis]TQL05753.1 type II secretion system protein I (GspI) [Pseudomonas sp. SLBN-26]
MTRFPRRHAAGFTLVEVLVALAIVAVAMSAAVRAAGVATQGSGLLRDRSLALLAARSELAEAQLQGRLRGGREVRDCDQGRLRLACVREVTRDGELFSLRLEVQPRDADGPPLARLNARLPAQDAGAVRP